MVPLPNRQPTNLFFINVTILEFKRHRKLVIFDLTHVLNKKKMIWSYCRIDSVPNYHSSMRPFYNSKSVINFEFFGILNHYRQIVVTTTKIFAKGKSLCTIAGNTYGRGRPSIIFSDNGNNLDGANNLFKTIDWNDIEIESTIKKIQQKFSPPSATWWGGFWEHFVQMVIKILRRTLGQSSLNYEELMTVLCELKTSHLRKFRCSHSFDTFTEKKFRQCYLES